ncbi:hypothetical protein F5148DRAFT_1276653 [Russula earlei]|uniref:Uncharacterized protein n=1 Tax=Russula earlei TaxID=71964 RepID=A0ACC0U3T5_9AGAM|nr:hypothetical protein F5148DRAFT_1276653 [Russula earlei]
MSYQPPSADPSSGNRSTGVAHAPGNRTPRRVQWASAVDDDDDVGRLRDRGPESQVASTHELDETGLDSAAFRTLAHALERHSSSSASPIHATSTFQPPGPSTWHTTSSADSPVPTSPSLLGSKLNIPGEVFIEHHERAGLPVLRRENKAEGFYDSQVRAADVVRAHSRNPFSKRFYHRRSRSTQALSKEGDDREETADTTLPMARTRGGILAALLTLYDQDSDLASVSDSVTTASTRTPEPHARVSPTHSFFEPVSASGRRLATLPKALHLPEARPRRERNAAGVWGPLITSTTGTLVGAAAPTHSTIAPDAKRPGYHLSRYSLDSHVPKAPPSASSKRPRSMLSEAGSQHQSASSSPSQTPTHPNLHFDAVPSESASLPPHGHHTTWAENWRDLSKRGINHARHSPDAHMATNSEGLDEKGYLTTDTENEARRDLRTWRRERKKRRRKAEIYITRHISSLISRQTFVLKLARAMMMFGGPTHRLQAQIQSTARVLDISLSCLYLPDVMLIAFDDDVTSTSNVKLIRQGSSLDLGKLQDAHKVYWRVIHDEMPATDASAALDALMLSRPLYPPQQLIFFGGMASASICSVSFNGSFIDSLASFLLGALLVFIQILSVRNELYSNVFEITIATLLSFLSAALAQTHKFCYSAVASSSVVLILPGFIVLCGSLELSSRNIVAGAVRLCYALVYSLFLGFGLAIGAQIYEKMTGLTIFGPEDYLCSKSHSNAPWFRKTPSHFWAYLTVPMFSLFLSLRNQAPLYRKELAVLVAISCVGWVTNHFVSTRFPNQSDISAAVGAFAVGVIANVYGRFFRGNAFAVMITGILFQLPSGLGNGGLLHFASQQASGSSTSYLTGFQVALQLISVSIGLTVGLGISLALVFPIQSRKRKGGVFSL